MGDREGILDDINIIHLEHIGVSAIRKEEHEIEHAVESAVSGGQESGSSEQAAKDAEREIKRVAREVERASKKTIEHTFSTVKDWGIERNEKEWEY